MGIFSGCLMACDIDGTLMANNYINPRNIEKIDYFMKEGGYFSLSTGRTIAAVAPALKQLHDVSPSVTANGCMVYDFKNQRVVFQSFLPNEAYDVVKKVADSGLNIGIEAHSEATVLTVFETRETIDHQIYEEMTAEKVDEKELRKYTLNKVLFAFSTEEERAEGARLIGDPGEGYIFYNTAAMIDGRWRYYYEMLPKGISKASALDKLAKMLKIDKGCLFAIGDYYNDLEMIKKADISAVPVEAPEDVKAYADYITGSCDGGAVADFIDYLSDKRKGMI